MNFRIADTFTDSLGRLANHEQKAAKMTAFDLQLNPSGSGKSLSLARKALASALEKVVSSTLESG